MKIQTKNLTRRALDWAVAKCLGYVHADGNVYLNCWAPSTEWSQGGPIIDRLVQEGMCLLSREYLILAGRHGLPSESTYCEAHLNFIVTSGYTPLIAAMRCYVSSKLGEEIEIPDELVNL